MVHNLTIPGTACTSIDLSELDHLKGCKDKLRQLILANNPVEALYDPLILHHYVHSKFPNLEGLDERPVQVATASVFSVSVMQRPALSCVVLRLTLRMAIALNLLGACCCTSP